jgi:hypothetical protein
VEVLEAAQGLAFYLSMHYDYDGKYPEYGQYSPPPSALAQTRSQDVHIYSLPPPDGSTKVVLKLVRR